MTNFFQETDFPEFTESELRELALTFPCRVELFHSNVCYGVEKNWPKHFFRKENYNDLLPHQKQKLQREMERKGVRLYRRYVDENRLERRRKNRTNQTLAAYYEERYIFNLFTRIRKLGDMPSFNSMILTDSESSWTTEIDAHEMSEKGSNPDVSDWFSDNDKRILYEYSSEEESNEECIPAPKQQLNRSESKNMVSSSTQNGGQMSSASQNLPASPSSVSDVLEPIATPTIQNLRQLRSRLVQIDPVSAMNAENIIKKRNDRNVTIRGLRMKLRSGKQIVQLMPKTKPRRIARITDKGGKVMKSRSETTEPSRAKRIHRPSTMLRQERDAIAVVNAANCPNVPFDRNVTVRRPRMELRSGKQIVEFMPKTKPRQSAKKTNNSGNGMETGLETTVRPRAKRIHMPFLIPKKESKTMVSSKENISISIESSFTSRTTTTIHEVNNDTTSQSSVNSTLSKGDDDDANKSDSLTAPRNNSSEFVLINSNDVIKFRHRFEDHLEFVLNPMLQNTLSNK